MIGSLLVVAGLRTRLEEHKKPVIGADPLSAVRCM